MDANLKTAELFARIAEDLLADGDEERTLQRIAESAVAVVDGCDFAGISVRNGRRVETAASTEPIVNLMDDKQYELQEGPCLDALRAPEDVFLSHELAQDGRWPRWAPQAAELGARSILSVRLPTTRSVLAGMNLYGTRSAAFDDDDVQIALVLARHAAVALQVNHQVTGLETALESRHQIGVAQGILMQRYGLSVDQSFQLLLRVSQTHNVKLREVARRVVEGDPAALGSVSRRPDRAAGNGADVLYLDHRR